MVLTFFGLRPEDKSSIILEPTFLLMYYGGFTYRETYNMPVSYKRWFIERISKELSRGESGNPPPSRADTQETREMSGMSHPSAPSRLRRFT